MSDRRIEMAVPLKMGDGIRDRQYYNACAATDCPPSTLTRYLSDRTEIDGRATKLVVGVQDRWALCPGGTDCPPATLTRFRTDTIEIDGMTIELLVGWQRAFDVFHPGEPG